MRRPRRRSPASRIRCPKTPSCGILSPRVATAQPRGIGFRVGELAIVVAVGLSLFCLAIVVFPLVLARYGRRTAGTGAATSQDALEYQAIREAILTLRLDHDLGKIGPEQYQEQLQGYRLAAADALRRHSEAEEGAMEMLLEEEVLAARSSLGPTGSPAGDSGGESWESTETSFGR